MRENMKIFLNTTSESDTLHDVVFEVYFYTYTFEYFMSILIKVNFLLMFKLFSVVAVDTPVIIIITIHFVKKQKADDLNITKFL